MDPCLPGLRAKEIHLCGEASTGRLLEAMMSTTEDEFEIREYQRLTKLSYLEGAIGNSSCFTAKENGTGIYRCSSLETFDQVRAGDCFVCFNKNDIFHITRELEKRGHEVAVIYGSLPPGTDVA